MRQKGVVFDSKKKPRKIEPEATFGHVSNSSLSRIL